ARRGGRGDAAEGFAGGALVGVGRLAQRPTAEHRGGDVQRVGGGLGGISGGGRAAGAVGPDVRGGVRGRLRRVLEQGGPLGAGQRDVFPLPGRVPAQGELGPGEVGGELAAGVPDGLAVLVHIAVQRHGVPRDLGGALRAVARADGDPRGLQAGEELLRGGGRGRGCAHRAAQGDPGRFVQAVPGGLLVLGAGGAAGRGPVRRAGGPQPV